MNMAVKPDVLKGVHVIDADTQVTEVHDLWTSRAPASFKDRVPQVKTVNGEAAWYIDGDQRMGPAMTACCIKKDGEKTFGNDLTKMKIGDALLVNSINMAIMLGVILAAGWLSDKVGRKPVMGVATVGIALFGWPLMALMQTGDFWNVFLGQLGFVLLIGSYNAVNPIAICELFPRSVRCSAVSTPWKRRSRQFPPVGPRRPRWKPAPTAIAAIRSTG